MGNHFAVIISKDEGLTTSPIAFGYGQLCTKETLCSTLYK